MRQVGAVARIVGWRQALSIALRRDEIKLYFERIWFCHHNARVIADFERRMSELLCHCTRGMSKPYYTIEAMKAEITDYINQAADEAISDWCEEHCIDRDMQEDWPSRRWGIGENMRRVFRLGWHLGLRPELHAEAMPYALAVSALTGVDTVEGDDQERWAARQLPKLQELVDRRLG